MNWGIQKTRLGIVGVSMILLLAGRATLFAQSFPSMPPQHYPPTPSSPAPPAYTPIPPGTLPAPAKPAAPIQEKERGTVNPRTGEFYPGTYGGVIDPKIGVVLPKVEGGYQNPLTGEIIPQNRTGP